MKMVTTFNTKDMVSFGNYLLSVNRENRIIKHHKHMIQEHGMKGDVESSIRNVSKGDFGWWKSKQDEGQSIDHLQSMCEESLSPDLYEGWVKIQEALKLNRKI